MWIQVILSLKIGITSGFHFWLNLQILAIAIVWLATFLGAVPCHKQLSLGHNPKTIDRLIGYNWIRTVFWSVVDVIVTNPPFGGMEEVWFFEHPYPEGYKSYSRSKPLTISEFDLEKNWWGGAKREGRVVTANA